MQLGCKFLFFECALTWHCLPDCRNRFLRHFRSHLTPSLSIQSEFSSTWNVLRTDYSCLLCRVKDSQHLGRIITDNDCATSMRRNTTVWQWQLWRFGRFCEAKSGLSRFQFLHKWRTVHHCATLITQCQQQMSIMLGARVRKTFENVV